MSTGWMLYWWTRLDNIQVFLGLSFAFLSFASIGLLVAWITYAGDYYAKDKDKTAAAKKYFFRLLSIMGVVSSVMVFLPSSKDMAIIVGGQLAANVAQSPEAKQIGNKVLQVINQELDSRISRKDKQ